ncbi:MAG TPA: ATP-binding protein [Gemmatimonadaceae bacterium]|nr:ATP-binding protein [Gemmatimonadaceae bacterium]
MAAVPSPVRSDAAQLLEGVIAHTADAVVCTDDAQRILIFNPAAERIFGYRRDEVLGETIDRLLPRSARGTIHPWFERVASAGGDASEHRRLWGRRKSGELFPAESSISKTTVGEATYFTALLRDVSQERRAEKERAAMLARTLAARAAAEQAEQRMAFLADIGEILHSSLAVEETFDALLHLIVPELAMCCVVDVLDAAGRVRRAHVTHGEPARQELAARLRAYPREQSRYITRRAIERGEPELVATVSDEFLASLAENDEHLEILRGLGLASIVIVPLRAHGRVLGALMLARGPDVAPYTRDDLSFAHALAQRAASALDNARLYDEARRAVRAREDVLGVVSHDLRSPLSVIAMCATALLGDESIDAAHDRETLETVQRSARWAQRLIQDLLDVSAIEAGGLSLTRGPEDPRMLVTRAVLLHGELAAERQIQLVTEPMDRLPLIDVDSDRIVQALGNLIGNALKFTPYGGIVRVGAENEGDHVRLYVTDSGPGIPDEDATHMFDRFWTAARNARARGTGMGLAIVRGIVDAHRGKVWLEPAQPESGATFSIALSVAPVRAG